MELTIFTDGGSRGNPGPAGIGVTVQNQDSEVVFEASQFIGEMTNNEAEYQAFVKSLEWLVEFKDNNEIAAVVWNLDSKLVVEQLNRNWKIKEPRMKTYALKAWDLLQKLSFPYQIKHVRREFNKRADALVNEALDAAALI